MVYSRVPLFYVLQYIVAVKCSLYIMYTHARTRITFTSDVFPLDRCPKRDIYRLHGRYDNTYLFLLHTNPFIQPDMSSLYKTMPLISLPVIV